MKRQILVLMALLCAHTVVMPITIFKSKQEKLVEEFKKTDRDKEKIKKLLKEGADPNVTKEGNSLLIEGKPLLLWAINNPGLYEHPIDWLEILLAAGADPNKADNEGRIPLTWAALKRNSKMVQMLLDAGADPNKANNWGNTPLLLAAGVADPVVVFSGAGVYFKPWTDEGQKTVVQMLLDAGADPNKANEIGFTPLMAASKHGKREIVEMLIDAGADPDIKSNNGNTALDLAKTHDQGTNEYKEIKAFLGRISSY